MVDLIRQGVCNSCGQCCGADGSPNQTNPWPPNWARGRRDRNLSDLNPMLQFIGTPFHGGQVSRTITVPGHGQARILWIEGRGICKNLHPWNDHEVYSLECPFLLDDPGDGTRPCSLVGGNFEWIWEIVCNNGPSGNGIPPMVIRDRLGADEEVVFSAQGEVDLWKQNHPLCSFDWVEE